MNLKQLATTITLIFLGFTTHAQNPHIALLLTKDGRHNNEFDAAFKELGWQADPYRSYDKSEMRTLINRLADYDILLLPPLFNFKNQAVMPGDDRKAYMKFIEQGGMLAVTDGSYGQVLNWLADINPGFGGMETGKCNSSQWEVKGYTKDADPPHPLRFFPSRISEPNSWPHFLNLPEGKKWTLVANCSEGFPVTVAQTIGKGLVSLSVLRQPSARQLSNYYGCLQLVRAGIRLKSFQLTEPSLGDGVIRLGFADEGPEEDCSFIYEIVTQKGEKQRFEGKVNDTVFELPYRISLRGPVTTRLLLKRDSTETLLYERTALIPQLLTLTPPAYRGILSTGRRFPTAKFGISVAPDRKQIKGAKLTLTVFDPNDKQLSETSVVIQNEKNGLSWSQPIKLDKSLSPGDYTLKAVLNESSNKQQKLATAETTFRILAPRAAQTIIDEDGTFLVNGKPFFPLGLYHVSPDDYPQVAKLGINTVQFWAWHEGINKEGISQGMCKLTENGLKGVFEFNHKGISIYQEKARKHGDNPALLMWYGLDEPSEGSYATAMELRDTLHEADIQHPVYTVSCRTDSYAEHASFADVFAIDPYGKPARAAECIPLAVKAIAAQGKPLVCVPGSFGKDKETPEEIRAVAYIALTYDARGIIWYPWSQAGGGPLGVGCKNSPEQQKAIAEVCTEINSLLPALFANRRWSIASEDGKLRGLLCDLGQQKVLIMVNITPEKIEGEMKFPTIRNFDNLNAKMKDYFRKRNDCLEVKKGVIRVSLEPYGTRACVF